MVSYSHHDKANMRHALQPYEAPLGASKSIDKRLPNLSIRLGVHMLCTFLMIYIRTFPLLFIKTNRAKLMLFFTIYEACIM